jgi:hypothetical protein
LQKSLSTNSSARNAPSQAPAPLPEPPSPPSGGYVSKSEQKRETEEMDRVLSFGFIIDEG